MWRGAIKVGRRFEEDNNLSYEWRKERGGGYKERGAWEKAYP